MMSLKRAMIKAFEYAIDNSKDDYDDIFVFSKENNISFSIFDKSYDFEKLKKWYDDIAEVSFNVYITKKTFI